MNGEIRYAIFKALRRRSGHSQKSIARKLGIRVAWYLRKARGRKCDFTVDEVEILANEYGVFHNDILHFMDYKIAKCPTK